MKFHKVSVSTENVVNATYLISKLAFSIHLKVLAHFCSELVYIGG